MLFSPHKFPWSPWKMLINNINGGMLKYGSTKACHVVCVIFTETRMLGIEVNKL